MHIPVSISKSSSVHQLNADVQLTHLEKKLWFYVNYLNNKNWFKITPSNFLYQFSPKILESDFEIEGTPSPSRFLSNLFWSKINWEAVRLELNNEIHVFDIGCGKGAYSLLINEYSGGITSYCGIDQKRNDKWIEFADSPVPIKLKQCLATNILDLLPLETNFIMSQSAFEHIEDDLVVFEKIAKFVATNDHPVIQVHLLPAPACLRLYRWHGVRQYTPRTALKILKKFQSLKHYAVLYALGGEHCNQLHYDFITKPLMKGLGDFRFQYKDRYISLLKNAVIDDNMVSKLNNPNFFALVIHSNYDSTNIFV